MIWLGAIWSFLKRIPAWVWLLILILCLGLAYGQHRHGSGKAEVQAEWDAQKAKDKAAAEKLNTEYRVRERSEQLAAVAAWKKYDEAILNGNKEAATLRADLLAERKRVRDIWRTGECDVSPDHAADREGESQTDLQAASIERIDRALIAGEAQLNLLIDRYIEAEKATQTKR